MPTPVWTLSVDLQTRTAAFQSGMSEAARTARGSFNDIKEGARDMGRETNYSMMEARHGVMLLGEEFGIHIPRALTSFIASLGPVGAAMEAAFPFLAIMVGLTLIIQHLDKMKSAAEKAAEKSEAWQKLADTTQEYGDTLRVTNERLQQQLSVLNGGMTNNLALALKEAAVQADQLASHLQVDIDKAMKLVEGQQVSLWSKLLNTEGSGDVTAKLRSDFDRAKEVIEQGKEQIRQASQSGNAKSVQTAETGARVSAQKAFGDMIVWVGQQLDTATAKQQKFNSESAAEKILPTSLALADQSQRIAILKGALEQLHQEYDNTTMAFAGEKLKIDIAGVEEAKKQIINIIGLVGPYTAMRQKMAKEDEKNAEERMRMESDVTRGFAKEYEEQNKLQAEAGKLEAEHTLKMGELNLAGKREQAKLSMSVMRLSLQEQMNMELDFANQDHQLKMKASVDEIAALDKTGKDYENKLKTLQNRQLEMTREYENQKALITGQAEAKKLSAVVNSETRMAEAAARTAASSIAHGQSMARAFEQMGTSMIQSALQNLLMMETVDGRKRLSSARTAASKAYEWGWEHGGPAAPVLSVVMGGLAFTAAMAFEKGGIVPGVGRGDIVPARLEPGEAVLPKRLTEGLQHEARHGKSDGGGDVHHHHVTNHIHAIDGASVKGMLDKHSSAFESHFHKTLRGMNK
jgi:hypothetical protein